MQEEISFKMPKKRTARECPEFEIDYRANATTCVMDRGGKDLCSIAYTGYVQGRYANSDLTKIFRCFVDTLETLPDNVSLNLENKIVHPDKHFSLLLVAIGESCKQREKNILEKRKRIYASFG
jgi:hypothetical protein